MAIQGYTEYLTWGGIGNGGARTTSPKNTVQGYDTGSHVLAYRGFGRYDSCDIPEEKEEEETEPQNPKYKNQKSIERSLEQASAKASPEVLCPPL